MQSIDFSRDFCGQHCVLSPRVTLPCTESARCGRCLGCSRGVFGQILRPNTSPKTASHPEAPSNRRILSSLCSFEDPAPLRPREKKKRQTRRIRRLPSHGRVWPCCACEFNLCSRDLALCVSQFCTDFQASAMQLKRRRLDTVRPCDVQLPGGTSSGRLPTEEASN